MPGRFEWDDKTGQLVEVTDDAPGAEASGGDVPTMVWDDQTGQLVPETERATKADTQQNQPHAEQEKEGLWEQFLASPAGAMRRAGERLQEVGERFIDEDIAASQGAWLNYLDDVMPAKYRDRIEDAAHRHPEHVAAGQGATAAFASELLPASLPLQAVGGAAVGAASARGRGAGWSETAGDAAIGGFGGAMGQLYGNMLGRAFGGTKSVSTPRAPGPKGAATRDIDDWLVNMHTPTDDEIARAGWLDKPEPPTWADVDELQVTRTDELLKHPSTPPTAGELALGEEQARRALLRSDPPRALRPTYEPRDPLADSLVRNPDLAAPGGLEEAAQGAPGSMPPGRPAPSAQGRYRDLDTGRMVPMRYEGMGPHPGVPMGPPPAPEFELGLERARTSVPPPLSAPALPPAPLRRTPGVDPDAPMFADGKPLPLPEPPLPQGAHSAFGEPPVNAWEMPADYAPPVTMDRVQRALAARLPGADVPGMGRAAVHASAGMLESVNGETGLRLEERHAYATAPVLSYTLQSVLASPDSGLPPDARQTLTDAVMSGDPQRVASQDYLLKQRYPAYARRIERELRALNGDE